jgi:formate C-acetyltransferase
MARKVDLHPDFWSWGLPERRAWFVKQVMVHYVPTELLPGDLIAGARFNIMSSCCLNEKEARDYQGMLLGKDGARPSMLWFHNHGFGNTGATSGHLVPDYKTVLEIGWKGIHADLERRYQALPLTDQHGPKGSHLRAMLTAATMGCELGSAYRQLCLDQAASEPDETRKSELLQMAKNLEHVPWEPVSSFWEAVQSLWLTHMLVMSDENYPGPGLSFGRIDQYLYPYWKHSLEQGMEREFGKEILKCFWMHANTAYDAFLRTGGNQGITAGYGQLLTLSGLGAGGADLTNDLTYAILEVIDEMSPILEPKPNVRLHRGTPDELLSKVVDMIAGSQGAPFLLNFDERSMAGMLLEARKAGVERLINPHNIYDYAPVGCLENTMVGNDRSGTVDNNLNLLKAVELALHRRLRFDPLPRPDDRQDRDITALGTGHRRPGGLPILGGILEGVCRANALHHPKKCGSLREIGSHPGEILPHALPVVSGARLRRERAGYQPGRRTAQLCHHRRGDLCHHGRFAPGHQVPGFRPAGAAPARG